MAVVALQVLGTLVVALVVALLHRYWTYHRTWERKLAGLDGPKWSLPIIGDIHQIAGPMSSILDRGLVLYKLWGPKPIRYWMGETPSVIITRAEDLEPLLSASRQVFKPELVYKPVRGFFGNGLIALSGEDWYRHRRVLTPAFHFKVLERYSGTFTRRAALFAEKLASLPEDESFDIMPHHSGFVTETIMETAFGMGDGASTSQQELQAREDFKQATADAFSVIAHRVMKPWLMIDALFYLSQYGKMQRKADTIINGYANNVIKLKKEQIRQAKLKKETEQADDDNDDVGMKKKFTFLDNVLDQDTDLMTDDEILQEVRTLIAVQQTSATTLSFIMVALAQHPDVQERALEEIRAVNALGLPALERLNSLKYLERVIKEALRLYPITALFSRQLCEEVRLPTCTLPNGLGVTMFVYATHRDPRHWPDPDRFDPDNFLPERCAGRHPYAYVPFSAGPRNCIGQRYAMLQMKAVVAAVLDKFQLTPGDGCEHQDKLKLNMDTFLYIRGGFNVRLRARPESKTTGAEE